MRIKIAREYSILRAHTVMELQEIVNELLGQERGWDTTGGLVVLSGTYSFAQAMTRYSVEGD